MGCDSKIYTVEIHITLGIVQHVCVMCMYRHLMKDSG